MNGLSFDEIVDELFHVLPAHLGLLPQRQSLQMQFAAVGQAQILCHLNKTYYEFLHPVKGLIVLAQFSSRLEQL
jgi:hypothetical protein